MAQRTATITHIQYHKKHARGSNSAPMDVSAIPDTGDLLTFAYGVWAGMKPHALWDRTKQFYCDPSPGGSTITAGRGLVLSAEIGTYGDPSSIKDVVTGEERLANTEGNLTNAVPQRLVLLVPQNATSAFLYVEHLAGGRMGGKFLDVLETAWRQQVGDYMLDIDTLARPDAWFQAADLARVSAQVYGYSADAFDGDLAKSVGDVHVTLTPPKGQRFFPKNLLPALRAKTVNRAKLLGLREEPDEVKVTLGDGAQARTFVLGREKTPAVRTLVTDWGQQRLTDAQFHAWCLNDCVGYFNDVGVEWHTAWNRGVWTEQDLATRVAVLDDQQSGGMATSN